MRVTLDSQQPSNGRYTYTIRKWGTKGSALGHVCAIFSAYQQPHANDAARPSETSYLEDKLNRSHTYLSKSMSGGCFEMGKRLLEQHAQLLGYSTILLPSSAHHRYETLTTQNQKITGLIPRRPGQNLIHPKTLRACAEHASSDWAWCELKCGF